ncbi:YifB family Mg chelatase-like AAA ATPase [uncultured Desulfobacter sp.]|uniref:YifB family Mg chelatase-like AAA ATPase n=1 Tax=uncultured Desulfobacter sp. TaxID=240139 RepID=UPI002AABAB09|nr:YifB family Mg chelatase-like AAA ATPase [uncultured Desulfobacter sp.]
MKSCAINGFEAIVVDVEVDITLGLPVFNMVGLAETAVRESRDRVRSALQNAGYRFPMDRVVVNLAPADFKKEGTGLDLPVALGILCAQGLFQASAAASWLFAAELSLDGYLRPVKAALPFALAARDNGFKGIIVPRDNGAQAALVKDIEVLAPDHLSQVVDFLAGKAELLPLEPDLSMLLATDGTDLENDFAHVRGQTHVKRAMEVAAAGHHHILLNGPAGSGKSLMAKCLPGIMPEPSFEEAMEIARVYSVADVAREPGQPLGARPFRSPHHSISDAGLVGGGTIPKPGEITLSHNGVLFLDELPEFRRSVLEVLRQPLEDGVITLARAKAKATYPCRFMLAAAMNPCPCGNFTNPDRECTCTPTKIEQYKNKISGPLMDRMDILVEVPRLSFKEMTADGQQESSQAIRKRVKKARDTQADRFKQAGIICFSNADMGPKLLQQFCPLDVQSRRVVEQAMKQFNLSGRAYASILKLARTIADLAGTRDIHKSHVLEAVQYKRLDQSRDDSR